MHLTFKQYLVEARYYSSDTIRLSGTLAAGTNLQHTESVHVVIEECGEEEDWGFTKAKPCILLDFEGGIVAAQYLKAPARVDFGVDKDEEGWYIRPLDEHDWIVTERRPVQLES